MKIVQFIGEYLVVSKKGVNSGTDFRKLRRK